MLYARYPAAIFANGFGDSLLVLPALRALAALFPERLSLICPPGMGKLFFSSLSLRSLCGSEMPQVPQGRMFDAERVAADLGHCDLLLSLNTTWHSSAVDALLTRLSPANSIGYFPAFDVVLPRTSQKHSSDLAFDVPKHLNPRLRLEDFAGPPVFPARAHELARRMRDVVPPNISVLIVHADTKPEKMWAAERFIGLLDRFLESHADFVVFVVGKGNLNLDRGAYGKRVMSLHELPLAVALALVGESDLFLGVDSCMLHAADMFGVPGVGLFGPTNSAEWGFRLGPHRHVCGEGSLDSISEDKVLHALESLLMDSQQEAATSPAGHTRSRRAPVE